MGPVQWGLKHRQHVCKQFKPDVCWTPLQFPPSTNMKDGHQPTRARVNRFCLKHKQEDLHADTGTCARTVEVVQKRRQERDTDTGSKCEEEWKGWMRNGHGGEVLWRTREAPGEAKEGKCTIWYHKHIWNHKHRIISTYEIVSTPGTIGTYGIINRHGIIHTYGIISTSGIILTYGIIVTHGIISTYGVISTYGIASTYRLIST